MAYLKDRNIDLCGENGEYHTLVANGPIFKRPLRLIESKIIARDNYWFLDTVKYQPGQCR
jgi:diphthine-ammonia ligase